MVWHPVPPSIHALRDAVLAGMPARVVRRYEPGTGWQPALRDVRIEPPEGWAPSR